MELPAAKNGVNLAAYRANLPLSVLNGKANGGFDDESEYSQVYGDSNSVTSHAPGALTGYDTIDAPPHYDFYTNTQVLGRRRRSRPSLYQLHANPEVSNLSRVTALIVVCTQMGKK